MICREFEPSGRLQPYIKSYIVIEDREGVIKNQQMSIYPSCYPEMVISYGDTVNFEDDADFILKAETGYLGGQIREPVRYTCSGSFKALSVIFRPWGIYRLFGIPQGEFTENRTDLEQITGKEMNPTIEGICACGTIEEKVQSVDSYFIKCLGKFELRDSVVRLRYAASMIEESVGCIDVGTLSETLNTNIKTIERHFKKLLGTPPKLFSRIIRFNKALNLLNSGTMAAGDIVYSLGYYDQSHFINEYKQFTGTTPGVSMKKEKEVESSFRELVRI